MNSTRRPELKPRKPSNGQHSKSNIIASLQYVNSLPKLLNFKRKTESDADNQPPQKKTHLNNQENNTLNDNNDESKAFGSSVNKYSANDRLKTYRKNLSQRTDEVVKVHSVLYNPKPKNSLCDSDDSTTSINNCLLKAKFSEIEHQTIPSETEISGCDSAKLKWNPSIKNHVFRTNNKEISTPLIQNPLLKTQFSQGKQAAVPSPKSEFASSDGSKMMRSPLLRDRLLRSNKSDNSTPSVYNCPLKAKYSRIKQKAIPLHKSEFSANDSFKEICSPLLRSDNNDNLMSSDHNHVVKAKYFRSKQNSAEVFASDNDNFASSVHNRQLKTKYSQSKQKAVRFLKAELSGNNNCKLTSSPSSKNQLLRTHDSNNSSSLVQNLLLKTKFSQSKQKAIPYPKAGLSGSNSSKVMCSPSVQNRLSKTKIFQNEININNHSNLTTSAEDKRYLFSGTEDRNNKLLNPFSFAENENNKLLNSFNFTLSQSLHSKNYNTQVFQTEICESKELGQFPINTNNNNLSLQSVNQSVNEDSDVDMEWSPVEVSEVLSDIQKQRQEKALLHMNNEQNNKNTPENNNDNIYVIVDTNVFISHLNTIKEIMNLDPYGLKYPVIIVPWMVVQELDFFKSESETMKNSARRAVKFINETLASKNQRLRGQTVQDALKQEAVSPNPDDGILFCCMQLAQDAKITVLLSNDVNLRNKSLIHGIFSYGTDDILAEVKKLLNGNSDDSVKTKGKQIISVFTKLCSYIIDNEMKLAYGTVASNLISDPPWSLKQCLIYFKRFWNSVFALIISQKQFIKVVDDMIYFHTSHTEISKDEDFEEFTKLCLSMCVYFKNCLAKYKDQVQNCITSIQDIAN